MDSLGAPDRARSRWLARGIRLECLTIGWNCLEAVLAVGLGVLGGSIALVGFGLDSVIEVGAGVVVLWRLRLEHAGGRDAAGVEGAERRALRLVGASFFALAGYVLLESGRKLWAGEPPEESPLGIALGVASLVVMPLLAWAKARAAVALGSRALRADAAETAVCAWLSLALVGGLGLNAWLGWWWADPAAALAMTPIMLREGREALRGEDCS